LEQKKLAIAKLKLR